MLSTVCGSGAATMNNGRQKKVDHSRGLDFYLPPPDDREYRRGRIQRLRDQITAWKDPSRPFSVSGPNSMLGTKEFKWLSTQRSCSSGRTANSCGAAAGGATGSKCGKAAPQQPDNVYFHDHIVFCVPSGKGQTESRGGADGMCYGVTTNKESMAECEQGLQQTHVGQRSVSTRSIGANSVGISRADGDKQGTMRSDYRSCATSPTPVATLQSIKAQSVDLASSVHEARMQCRQGDFPTPHSSQQQLFMRTMELPIDWGEYTRNSKGTTCASRGDQSVPKFDTIHSCGPDVSSVCFVNTFTGSNASSLGLEGRATGIKGESTLRSAATLHNNARRPLRLYSIQLKDFHPSRTSTITPGADAPRNGIRVKLKS
ncbi:hypothetical protein, conserved [Trypanosoma brucei brucei TREU927]|uniref:Uncharacterized protein n=1 Tax=Trypanosoma brucei brucei (strain 927/4 GUTat10.1) TaxID=185431 RepID=Q38FB5_TRYB2|nr:hypothetical protein, conserved [Trypanosoma brucei brucei TREU927]EAN76505.1 hypothetical protein, conserved [Trypanosoma brucei brucei TREU927]